MAPGAQESDDSWRLRAELAGSGDGHGAARGVVRRLRGPDVVSGAREAVAGDVVITHDGGTLFAYAPSAEALHAARTAIEGVLLEDGMSAQMQVSHWEDSLDEWRQVDPPLAGEQLREQQAATGRELAVETRTLVALAGRPIREEFEQTMNAWAQRLGLECAIVEHPHLLSTQVAFTVTGPSRRIDEFAQGLRAEEHATMRAERGVMLSPL